jgi:RNA polymerase sigma factor (TIGR02999 family)
MSTEQQTIVTELLGRIRTGDSSATAELLEITYGQLRGLAHGMMDPNQVDCTLQPTALVNEVCLRLLRTPGAGWDDAQGFFRVAARAMRNLLIDQARARRSAKRGGGMARVCLDGAEPQAAREVDLVALDDSLTRLAAMDNRLAETFEFRFLVGLSVERTAELLGVSPRTVELDTRLIRAWMKQELVG